MNTCFNALDRHVDDGRAEQLALIYDSPVTDTKAGFTLPRVARCGCALRGALRGEGVGHGDRVIVYMPMVPEALVAMLACARIGAVHSVVFGGFAANELATRIEDAQPKVVVTASCGIEPGASRRVQASARRRPRGDRVEAQRCIVLQRPTLEADLDPARDLDWHEAVARRRAGRMRPAPRDGPALRHLHVGDDRAAEGDRPRPRRPRRRARVVDEEHLRHRPGRGVLGRLGHRLDGRTLLHRLRPAAPRLHDRPLRGQAGRHARCGRLLARLRRARRQHALHRADGVPRDPPAGSQRRAHRRLRPVEAARALSRGRALRPRDAALGRGQARHPRHRPLLADGDRLAGRGELHRDRALPGRARLADARRPGMGPARHGLGRQRGSGG